MRQEVALGEKMYGVVLWSDCVENRAVIWCEDHGDLAFFRGEADGIMALTAGDLVEFDVCDGGEMRLAGAPRLISRKSFPTLGQELKKAGARMGVLPEADGTLPRSEGPDLSTAEDQPYGASGNVIPFNQGRVARIA
ncbi:hypothetical protein OO012_02935 [Rhodobacteraceae bacterium KMM 6894]|nr:hypothetical protein [Rhodobacteraceae bacterium KMM 6894]